MMLTLVFRHYPLFASAVGSRPPLGAVSVFWRRRQLITNLYIDGFNLYYRALKDTPFRWLDLHKLAETLFPEDTIHRVCYFTARLDIRPGNQGQPQRDVNLATRVLVDGFNGECEKAVVVSNDADFAGAMRFVRDGLGMRVVVVNPDPHNRSTRNLVDSATYVKRLWKSHLKRSQFPDTLTDEIGTITKPPGW